MPVSVLQALIVYMIISSFTPGPGNILALNTVTRCGWKRGKRLIYGIFAGYYAVQIICAAAVYGLSRILSAALVWMKYIGAVYQVWLAIHMIRSKPDAESTEKKPSFWTGFMLQFVNVKIYLYGLSALSGYIVPYYGKLWQLLAAEIIIATLGSAATLTWSFAGIRLRKFYQAHFRPVNVVLSLFLLYCAVSMLL